jgi:carotenoid 1,2-hydratase
VFSPYYAWARRRGAADPLNHCGLNVVLYGARGKRWALTERGRNSLDRGPDWLSIGPSAVSWNNGLLTLDINEVTVPFPSRIRGRVRVHPAAMETRVTTLDDAGRHRWSPIAPCARVEVTLDDPALHWSGTGYFDTNNGDVALETDFIRWDWSRAATPTGTAVLYELTRKGGDRLNLGMRYDRNGGVSDFPPPPQVKLPRTKWRVARNIRSDAEASVLRTLEDTPFYARSRVSARLSGAPVIAMHESLSLERFRLPVVQAMLPFRMPRAFK